MGIIKRMSGRVRVSNEVTGKDAVKEVTKPANGRVIVPDTETTTNSNSTNIGRVMVKQELNSSGKVRE